MKTNFKYITILFILLSFSCKNSEEDKQVLKIGEKIIETPVITDEFRTQVLIEVLEDKNIINRKRKPVIRYCYYDFLSFDKKLKLTIKELNEPDSLFLLNQNDDLIKFKLTDSFRNAFKVIDDSNFNISEDSLITLDNYIENNGMRNINSIIFNKKLNIVSIVMQPNEGLGYQYIYKKVNKNWILKNQIQGH